MMALVTLRAGAEICACLLVAYGVVLLAVRAERKKLARRKRAAR